MHWYDKVGNTAYEVRRADGKGLRPTTLADAKKLQLVPSVTTVMAVASKTGLDIWKINQIYEAIKIYRNFTGNDEEWIRIIKEHSTKISRKAAERGTQLHDRLEKTIINGTVYEEDYDYINPVISFLNQRFPGVEWIPEKSFSNKIGFGGKIDLISKCSRYIVDFKTKDLQEITKKNVYDDHVVQLAAYRIGLELGNSMCYNLFISTAKSGVLYLHEWTKEELYRGEEMFKALLGYWKLLNKYDSSY